MYVYVYVFMMWLLLCSLYLNCAVSGGVPVVCIVLYYILVLLDSNISHYIQKFLHLFVHPTVKHTAEWANFVGQVVVLLTELEFRGQHWVENEFFRVNLWVNSGFLCLSIMYAFKTI
jgi:hypothetical protein